MNSDVFTSDQCQVRDTSWVKFKIELNKNAQPVKQKVHPLPPPLLKHIQSFSLMIGCAIQ